MDYLNPDPSINRLSVYHSNPLNHFQGLAVLCPLADIDPAVEKLYFTDMAWDGNSSFVTDEGTAAYSISEDGIKIQQLFGLGVTYPDDKGTWDYEGPFDLSTSFGDNLLIYCLNEYGEPHFVSALTYNGNFSEPNLDSYTFSETALPAGLENHGGLALPFYPNYLYQGPQVGDADQIREAFSDPENYVGSMLPYDIDTSVGGSGTSGAIKPAASVPPFILLGVLWMSMW